MVRRGGIDQKQPNHAIPSLGMAWGGDSTSHFFAGAVDVAEAISV